MEIYEVDLRNRKTGNSEKTIYSGSHDKAYKICEKWNEKNVPNYNNELLNDSWIDGSDGYIAEVYEVVK